MEELNYGNWIRKRVLVILGLTALCLGILTVLPTHPLIRVLTGILAIVLFVSFLYPLYSYYMFSPHGGNLQEKFYDLIIKNIGQTVTGKALDIGTGNGILAIKLAQTHPNVEVVAMDFWGKSWEYSRSVCQGNASLAHVSSRVNFVKGDAACLDYPDGSFDAAVSNLTFHEVKSVHDKREVAREALRVLKSGGAFAFIDYFYDSRYYGPVVEFEAFLRGLGLSSLQMRHVRSMIAIPKLLQHRKILGKVGIVYGRK